MFKGQAQTKNKSDSKGGVNKKMLYLKMHLVQMMVQKLQELLEMHLDLSIQEIHLFLMHLLITRFHLEIVMMKNI